MWFNKHFDLTFLIVLVSLHIIGFIGYMTINSEILYLTFAILLVILGLLNVIWYLKQKNRSLYFLFLGLASIIGLAILIALKPKPKHISIKKIAEEVPTPPAFQ